MYTLGVYCARGLIIYPNESYSVPFASPMHAYIFCTGPQATAISAVSNTQLETDDMHMDTVATSTGTENEGALNRATGNQQVVTEMVEDMDIGKSRQSNVSMST